MPTYEFRCPDGHEFEKFYRSISGAESQAVCPVCGKPAERMMSAAGFAFKGSGFYLTDYGKNAHRGEAAPTQKSGESSSGESSSDSSKPDSSSGTETKAAGAGSESAKSSESSSSAKTESKTESKAEKKAESKPAEGKPAKAPPKPGKSE